MNDVAEVGQDDIWHCASPEALQRTTDLARRVLKAPVSLLSSFTPDEQILRSTSGFELLEPSLPLSGNVCRRVVNGGHQLVVDDISKDLSGATVPKDVVAYVGAPLRLSSGRDIGTLCVMDFQSRDWSKEDVELITELAAFLAIQIELKLEVVLREKTEAALNTSKAQLLAVADHIPGLVFERRKRDAIHCNYTFFGSGKMKLPAVREMMENGASGGLDFVHRDDRDVVRAAILRSNIEETDLDLTFRVKELDGEIRWIRSQSVVRRDGDGTVCWDGLCFDISDLVTARERAESARAAKDEIVVNVNHELRTPLQAIIGFTDFLKMESQPETIETHARNIQTAAESMLAIINQSLAEAGGNETQPTIGELVDLGAFGEMCLSMVGPATLSKNLMTRFELDRDAPRQSVLQRQQVKQAVLNLLNNAVKFTDKGEVRLRVSRATRGIRFSICDTGIGIPADRHDLLFQRFSRVESTERSTEGNGLGLSITKELVEGMGGQVGFDSHVGRGSTFWFEIPAQLDAHPVTTGRQVGWANENVAKSEAPEAETRILLADDLDLNRKLIADMLGTDGHVVDCVADGAEAVRAASERRYDIILMDMIMPGMDGIAATREIRQLPPPACDVPILALTAHSFKDQLESCLTAGMNATLTKPMSLEALTSAVSNWTRKRKAA